MLLRIQLDFLACVRFFLICWCQQMIRQSYHNNRSLNSAQMLPNDLNHDLNLHNKGTGDFPAVSNDEDRILEKWKKTKKQPNIKHIYDCAFCYNCTLILLNTNTIKSFFFLNQDYPLNNWIFWANLDIDFWKFKNPDNMFAYGILNIPEKCR